MLAVRQGCVTLAGGVARIHTLDGQTRRLGQGITALARDREELLLATPDQVQILDPSGATRSRLHAAPGVTALARVGPFVALGFRDGGLDLLWVGSEPQGARAPFEGGPSSAVVSLAAGPMDTLVSGHAGGHLVLWSLGGGPPLHQEQLHGPVRHLWIQKDELLAVTELGDRTTLDLGVFRAGRCELLRQVWRQVPVVWEGGRPLLRSPPREHPCRAGVGR